MRVLFNEASLNPCLGPFPESHLSHVVRKVGIQKKIFCWTEPAESHLIHQHLAPQMMTSSAPWLHTESGPPLCTFEYIAPCFWIVPIFLILRLISCRSSSNCLAAPATSWENQQRQPCAIVPNARYWLWVMRLQGQLCSAPSDHTYRWEHWVSLTSLLWAAVNWKAGEAYDLARCW